MDDFDLVHDLGPFEPPPASTSASHYDDMFDSYFNRSAELPEPSPSSPPPGHLPVFDKPVFDDDPDVVNPFGAIPLFGVGVEGKDFLDNPGKATKPEWEPESVGFDEDLVSGIGRSTRSTTPVTEEEQDPGSTKPMMTAPLAEPDVIGFDDDVISKFGESTSQHDSTRAESRTRQGKESISSSKTSVSMQDDPFVILGATSNLGYSSFGLFTDNLDNLGMPAKSESTKFEVPSTSSGILESHDIFGGVLKPANEGDFGQNRSLDDISCLSHSNLMPQEKPVQRCSAEAPCSILPEMHFTEASDIHETPGTTSFQIDRLARNTKEQLQEENPEENRYSNMPNDVWLTVSDIVLVTQPTSAPPPSRPPPPLSTKQPPAESNSSKTYPQYHNPSYNPFLDMGNSSKASQSDEQKDFVMGKPADFANGHTQIRHTKGIEQDWADWRHTKGVNRGESDSIFTRNQYQEGEINEKAEFYAHKMANRDEEERSEPEQKQRENEEEQRRLERMKEDLESEREKVRKREEEERKRHEKEKEARQAVEKAILEARERAAARIRMQTEKEAHQRAERAAVQKVAEEARARAAADAREGAAKIAAEAKERAAKIAAEAKEREAVEAREMAAAEARERAAKVAAEAKERAAVEAREMAAAEARERAAKVAAEAKERAAVEAREMAAAEARERTAKAAAEVRREREAAEARERAIRVDTETKEKVVAESQAKAAAEARCKAERAAVQKAVAEARRRAERAAVERATSEARQRAATEARERAADEARARENQQRTAQPDLNSFFGVPSRSDTVPRSQTTTNPFDVQPQGSADFGAARSSFSGSASPFTQPPSSNLMDDLSSIFGAPSSSALFQEVGGESEERRKARLERHQRTMERVAKAVAEKNERDLQVQFEQEERHRIGGTFDFEIKRWAAGKEGNLRALLSTLQYILWPECGWQPISLTDLITAASVKKVYRKATLCIHPDKVQQKGANLQQKYIAEKVFDLLKEAWNKFNSEELF